MILRIGKWNFLTSHNIENLVVKTEVNVNAQNTLTSPVYTQIGGVSESVSFDAKILIKDVFSFREFKKTIKKGQPLAVECFDLIIDKKILITSLTESPENFVRVAPFGEILQFMGNFKVGETSICVNNEMYLSKKLTISGYLIDADATKWNLALNLKGFGWQKSS